MKKSGFMWILAGALFVCMPAFAEDMTSNTSPESKAANVGKKMFYFSVTWNMEAKNSKEAMQKNDANMAKAKAVFQKYNLKSVESQRNYVSLDKRSFEQGSKNTLFLSGGFSGGYEINDDKVVNNIIADFDGIDYVALTFDQGYGY